MITKLDWDSNFFELNIGKITEIDLKTDYSLEKYDLLYLINQVKQEEEDNITFTKLYKLTYQENKIVFIKRQLKKFLNIDQKIREFNKHTDDINELYEIAYISGENSRFKLDKNFKIEEFKNLYRKWVDNSINKQIADKTFVYTQDSNILGFATVKMDLLNSRLSIGILGVVTSSQTKGIGTKLMHKVEMLAIENDIKEILVPTQSHNIKGCNFYRKSGFEAHTNTYIKHYWKKNDPI